MSNPIKTAIVGFGAAGKFMHAPFIVTQPQHYEVVAVLERNLEESKQLFPAAKIVRSIDALLQLPEIELVIITTPNETHLPYTKAALLAGKNVVLEKPFTISSADAHELIALSKQVNKTLSVFQNRRYVTDFLTIKEILHKNLLGDIHEFEAHYHRYRPEARAMHGAKKIFGSGILYDLGSHLIVRRFIYSGFKTVTADIRLQRPHAEP